MERLYPRQTNLTPMKNRIACVRLRDRVVSAAEAAACIRDGMTVAVGGYTNTGYPKAIARELVARNRNGEDFQIRLLSGANDGPLDTLLGEEHLISWRAPLIESKTLAKLVNARQVTYVEQQMNKMPRLTRDGAFGEIDVAVVEALRITEEGYLVPTASVGMVPHFLEQAKSVIVEINMAQPLALEGMHDIYLPGFPPNRRPIPLVRADQHIGTPYIRVDPEKIRYIVRSDELDETPLAAERKPQMERVAENLLSFLSQEVRKMPGGVLPPIQTGFGGMATEIVRKLGESDFEDLQFFCGILQEANMELIASGKATAASTGSIQMTPRVIQLLEEQPELFRKRVVIRNTDVTNSAEAVSRLGLITLNSGIEMDLYGNVNSSHVAGTKVVNGLGGGAGFASNAGLSVMLFASETKGGAISTIVPMVTHQDISEHDVDVVVTDMGVADLRGKDDVERARCIVENCAGPHYREPLRAYLEKAVHEVGGHHPQLLREAFAWHIRLGETGSMREPSN